MKAHNHIMKGQVIRTMEPSMLFPPLPFHNQRKPDVVYFDVRFCRTCGCAAELEDDHGSRHLLSTLVELPGFEKETKNDVPTKPPNGTVEGGWYYCSIECKKKAKEWYDSVMDKNHCNGENGGATMKFLNHIFPSKSKDVDSDDIALFVATIMYCNVLEGGARSWKYFEYDAFVRNCQEEGSRDVDERVMECWLIIRSEFLPCEELKRSKLLTAIAFNNLYQHIRQRNLYHVPVSHPLEHYIQHTLLTQTDDNLKVALEAMNVCVPLFHSKNGSSIVTKDDADSKVARWRIAARLVQAISGNLFDDEEMSSIFDDKVIASIVHMKRCYFALCPDFSNIQHSCVPNSIIESNASGGNTGAVSISLVAMHDIQKADDITVSRIQSLTGSADEREAQLQQIFGSSYQCDCVRCQCEQNWHHRGKFNIVKDTTGPRTQRLTFHWTEMKRLGDMAMQQTRYKDACEYYRLALTVSPKDGDMLHAKCASYLERGKFQVAQDMWRNAYKICPLHEGIALHVEKQNAYDNVSISQLSRHQDSRSSYSFETIIPSECFVTNPEDPIISPTECRKAIQWAEDAAASRGGFSTSRHYAVPTTDIPIHEVPLLLKWFNEVLRERLRPLLAMQFGENEVGKNGSGVYIHDAFLVRYDASGGQNHLPLHRDQSTHSFTIALNPLSDYDGGGTYIAPLKRAIRPSVGGALSFRGDKLLHGGDPVVRGRRYIIVAFCYVCKQDLLESRVDPIPKKMKLEEVFFKGNKQESKGNFSFGFM